MIDLKDVEMFERHLLAIILDEIRASQYGRKHADFARAAFGDEVSNYNGKWFRLRSRKNELTVSDLLRIAYVLDIEPALLLAQASMKMRKKSLSSVDTKEVKKLEKK